MAEYTIELRDVLKYGYKLFDFNYPFYDASKKAEFEEAFIRHFYFREIGTETIDRFKWYLEDKFMTVLPYYNELFKAAQIEYNILDNYKLEESYTIKRENTGKTSGVTSTVGQTFDNQSSETATSEHLAGTSEGSEQGTTHSETDATTSETGTTSGSTVQDVEEITDREGTNKTDTDGTVTSQASGSDTTTRTGNNKSVNIDETTVETIEKRIDTPQGIKSTDDFDAYMSGRQDTETKTDGSITKTDTISETDKTEKGTTVTDTTDTSVLLTIDERTERGQTVDTETNETRTNNGTGKTTTSGTTSGENSASVAQDTTGNTSTTTTGEQKTTHDNNTRTESVGTEIETHEILRKGNIGVDTDSDAIEKHLRLQKTLTSIQKMFFDECEDLFMLVY